MTSWFNPFSTSRPSQPENDVKSDKQASPAPANDTADEEPVVSSSGFDHDKLVQAAEAIKKMNNSKLKNEVIFLFNYSEFFFF